MRKTMEGTQQTCEDRTQGLTSRYHQKLCLDEQHLEDALSILGGELIVAGDFKLTVDTSGSGSGILETVATGGLADSEGLGLNMSRLSEDTDTQLQKGNVVQGNRAALEKMRQDRVTQSRAEEVYESRGNHQLEFRAAI
ncbi:hypothetical protein J6590_008586 [Homalodisca vitripennis]|nr:hypothetical protein J6590_008586 [Homalodisca vitripennis]